MERLIESGIYEWWDELFISHEEMIVERYWRKILDYQEPDTAPPVSMDFEIMGIFPFSGYLLGVAALVFSAELMLTLMQLLNRPYFGLLD